MTTLYISPFVEKQVDELQSSSRKGRLALDTYVSVCEILQEGDEFFSKRTKHGENRLVGCVKYDLGSGYRLVTVRKKRDVHLVCLGTHDEVDTWLERNRNWAPSSSVKILQLAREKETLVAGEEDVTEPDIYEEHLLEKVDEDVLKYVFAGLFRKRKVQAL